MGDCARQQKSARPGQGRKRDNAKDGAKAENPLGAGGSFGGRSAGDAAPKSREMQGDSQEAATWKA